MAQFHLFKAIIVVSVTVSLCVLIILSPNNVHFQNERTLRIDSEDYDNVKPFVYIIKRSSEDRNNVTIIEQKANQSQLTIDKLILSGGNFVNRVKEKHECVLHLAMIFTIDHENNRQLNDHSRLNNKLQRSLSSILKYSSSISSLCIHLITDSDSHSRAKSIITSLRHLSPSNTTIVFEFHDVDGITSSVEYLLPSLRSHFSYKPNSYYAHSLFFISLILHRVFTEIDKMILLDIDVLLNAKLSHLFDNFDNFTSSEVIGIAYEQQPVYRHLLHEYRRKVKNRTRIGGAPPDGVPGFNSGVLLLNFNKMRNSKVYNSLLRSSAIDKLASKYSFRGHLGDQDFYTIISFDHSQLFHIIPCDWNRQLCQWWRYHGYADVFDDYHRCDRSVKLFHGNCNSVMPQIDYKVL